jgi:hypothetical protein
MCSDGKRFTHTRFEDEDIQLLDRVLNMSIDLEISLSKLFSTGLDLFN